MTDHRDAYAERLHDGLPSVGLRLPFAAQPPQLQGLYRLLARALVGPGERIVPERVALDGWRVAALRVLQGRAGRGGDVPPVPASARGGSTRTPAPLPELVRAPLFPSRREGVGIGTDGSMIADGA